MDDKEQKRAAEKFVDFWQGKGYEKGQTQAFWLSLLREVFGVKEPEKVISFEDQVVLKNTNFIDAFIPSTRVLIEQKGSHIDLTQKLKQSDGSMLTPFQQARRYISGLSFSTYPRWIVVCNFSEFHVHDMERPDAPPEVIALENLSDEFHRLKFLVQDQREVIAKEKELSVAAGNIVGQLYDELLKCYKDPSSKESQHSLNVLCVRLVFCLYAEDAGIFGRRRMFHDYIAPYRDRPRDVRRAVLDLFEIFDTPIDERDPYLDDELAAFPYVNGSLFADARSLEIPNFTPKIVSLLLNEASEGFDWSKISPTIFGAVFESTLNPETRRKGGMHYTSIENIHKVIDPLFLNELKDELAQIRAVKTLTTKNQKLQAFHDKLASLTFLDPACGSGNFLTETYISLRRLENEVIRIQSNGQAFLNVEGLSPTRISLSQFYGFEINDFACAVAKTALWIAESQMLNETEDILGRNLPFFPLKTLTNIVEGNALRIDWEDLIPKGKLSFIIGNPPFAGARLMTPENKSDVEHTFGKDWVNVGNLDLVTCWFKKAVEYMLGTNTRAALVATNSISQGEQVANLWKPLVEGSGVHIDFAWRTFRWDSEASEKAHVHVVIVGFSTAEASTSKLLFDGEEAFVEASNINAYLLDGPDCFVESRSQPLCEVPSIGIGNQPIDDGNYLFTLDEREEFLKQEPKAKEYFKPWYGSVEFINRKPRYCLWLGDCPANELRKLPKCMERVKAVREYRARSTRASTVKLAERPTRFQTENMPKGTSILIPKVSSERRRYIPMGFMDKDSLCSDLVFLLPNATLVDFGVLTSSVHMAWMRAVAGRLKSDYRYSKDVVYNNFVWPKLDEKAKEKIAKTAQAILDARANHPEATYADLYDDLLMEADLRKAHKANDKAVLEAYGVKASASESEIVAHLMKLYVQKVAEVEKAEKVDLAVQKVIGKKAETIPDWMEDLRQQCLDGKITKDDLITQGKARFKEEKKKAKEAEKSSKAKDISNN